MHFSFKRWNQAGSIQGQSAPPHHDVVVIRLVQSQALARVVVAHVAVESNV